MDERDSGRQSPIMERHLQTLLLTVVAGLIAWQGVTTLKLTESTARQDERIVYLTEQVAEIHRELREQRVLFINRGEFERRMDGQDAVIRAMSDRVRKLEDTK